MFKKKEGNIKDNIAREKIVLSLDETWNRLKAKGIPEAKGNFSLCLFKLHKQRFTRNFTHKRGAACKTVLINYSSSTSVRCAVYLSRENTEKNNEHHEYYDGTIHHYNGLLPLNIQHYRRQSEWLNRAHLSHPVIVCTNKNLNNSLYYSFTIQSLVCTWWKEKKVAWKIIFLLHVNFCLFVLWNILYTFL